MSADPQVQQNLVSVHDYKIGNLISRGPTSSIRFAYHSRSKTPYAVKTINKQKLTASNRGSQILFNETVLAPLVNHPNLVDVYEIVDSENQVFQFMSYADHGDLLHYLKKREFNTNMAIKVIDQILAAVEYLHALGICHRDIKPENILLEKHAIVKLSDLGLASLTFNGEVSGRVGTFEYSAPEAINCHSCDGFKADMWSCGVIIYVIFARRQPFKNITVGYKYDDPVDYKYIPPEFVSLIQALLSLDPNKRPSATECRSFAAFHSSQNRKKPPLSSLYHDSFKQIETAMLLSTLSQVLDIPIDTLKERISQEEINREKLLYLLFKRRTYEKVNANICKSNEQRKSGFFALPADDQIAAVVERRNVFPAKSCLVYNALHSFLLTKKCCVSSPLSHSPTIVLHNEKSDARVSFHCDDDGETGRCTVFLCTDVQSAEFSSLIMRHLEERFLQTQAA